MKISQTTHTVTNQANEFVRHFSPVTKTVVILTILGLAIVSGAKVLSEIVELMFQLMH